MGGTVVDRCGVGVGEEGLSRGVGAPMVWAGRVEKGGSPKGGGPKGGEPNISCLFFPLPPQFSFFLLSWVVLSLNFGSV